jgi:hypothetical protein
MKFGVLSFFGHNKALDLIDRRLAILAGEQGFEPQLPDPESGVLPLNYSPLMSRPALATNLFVNGAEGEI